MIVLLSTSQVAIIKVWISQPAKSMTGLISGGDPRDPALVQARESIYSQGKLYCPLNCCMQKSARRSPPLWSLAADFKPKFPPTPPSSSP